MDNFQTPAYYVLAAIQGHQNSGSAQLLYNHTATIVTDYTVASPNPETMPPMQRPLMQQQQQQQHITPNCKVRQSTARCARSTHDKQCVLQLCAERLNTSPLMVP